MLPHHRTMSEMSRAAGRPYLLHSCGKLDAIMEDLIDDVKIDAKHSFQDNVMPVTEAKRRYGDRIGILGGVDDWVAFDSETVTLRPALAEVFPASGTAAGVKVHKELSIGRGCMTDCRRSVRVCQRADEPEIPPLQT